MKGSRHGVRRRPGHQVREVLGDQPGLVEKKIFGGLAFLLHGDMACGVRGEDLIVRVAAEAADAALDR
jgi:hypothetical protein